MACCTGRWGGFNQEAAVRLVRDALGWGFGVFKLLADAKPLARSKCGYRYAGFVLVSRLMRWSNVRKS